MSANCHRHSIAFRFAILPALIIAPWVAFAGTDVLRPAPVEGLAVDHVGDDIHLDWDAVTLDVSGQPETLSHYHVYRGTTPDFVPDRDRAAHPRAARPRAGGIPRGGAVALLAAGGRGPLVRRVGRDL